MEDFFESELPDLTDVSLTELLETQDPLVLAALKRIIASVGKEPQVWATRWDDDGRPHPLY